MVSGALASLGFGVKGLGFEVQGSSAGCSMLFEFQPGFYYIDVLSPEP